MCALCSIVSDCLQPHGFFLSVFVNSDSIQQDGHSELPDYAGMSVCSFREIYCLEPRWQKN